MKLLPEHISKVVIANEVKQSLWINNLKSGDCFGRASLTKTTSRLLRYALFTLFIFCSTCFNVSAQQETTVDTMVVSEEDYQSETVESSTEDMDAEAEQEEKELSKPMLRKISEDTMLALKSDKDFAYMQYADSFFRNRKKPEIQKEDKPEDDDDKPSFFDNRGLHKLYWGLAITAVLYLLWRMFVGNRSLFARNKNMMSETHAETTDDTGNRSMEKLIEKAILDKNYRLAIRYLYLNMLALLGEKDFVSLAPQKTNYQYLQELKGTDLLSAFSKLTLQYEYVWYGEFNLTNIQFNDIHEGFKKFERELK